MIRSNDRRWSSFQPKKPSADLCAHANEAPSVCPCGFGCYCKGRTCPRATIKAKAPRRIEEEKIFAPYVLWLHGQGAVCVVCGTSINIQGAHVARSLGTGRKHGLACDMVRLCSIRGKRLGCHEQLDRHTGIFEGWSDSDREAASRTWRLLHWSGFIAWIGAVLERGLVDAEEAEKLVACEQAIGRAWALLSGNAPGTAVQA